MKDPIYLSPPNIDSSETIVISEALESGWVAPIGPKLDQFERILSDYFEGRKVLLLNSGTAALHLSLILSNVGFGDIVLTSTLTFAACANVIRYQNAIPVFIDSDLETWNMDPDALESYLQSTSHKPKAIIVTHLYGVAAKVSELKSIADRYQIALIEDAAESLGSFYHDKPVGTFGDFGVISFNGNKVITTSGGGALICDESNYKLGRHLATQANKGIREYDHDQVGYNYRMSNVLASLGESQFGKLQRFIKRKREIYKRYSEELSEFFAFSQANPGGKSSYWLSVGLLKIPLEPRELIEELEEKNIESRRLWKPLHLHQAFETFQYFGDGIAEKLFDKGICLPSGTGLTDHQQTFVIQSIWTFFKKRG